MRQFKLTAVATLALLTLALVLSYHPASLVTAAPLSDSVLKQTSSRHAPDSEFTNVNATLPGVTSGNSVWGDYNNDGALDVALVGRQPGGVLTTTVYRGDGMGNFTQTASFTPTGISRIAWGDYNNDGKLDLLQIGDDINDIYTASVYTGDGQGHFPEDFAANLPGVITGGSDWGDYNHDGSPDILLSGDFLNSSGNGDRAFAGDRQGHFVFDPQLTAADTGKVAWGDFNNDGNLDFVLATDLGFDVQVYQGDGLGGFTLDPANLLPVHLSCAAWGDYNGDGKLDLVVSGRDAASNFLTYVYAGDGAGGFTHDLQVNLPGTEQGEVAWGDYNNDGNLDLLLTGFANTGDDVISVSKLYAGDGQGGFSEDTNANLAGINSGSVQWGDYNADGKLDIMTSGYTSSTLHTLVYRNDANIPANQPPTAPIGLSVAALAADTVQLSWQAATDDHTPATTLSYNLRVGTTPGGSDIVGPMADTTSGMRRLAALGNAQLNRRYTLSGLNPTTTYYWSVQAIDNGYMGGPFAAEGSFIPAALGTPTPTGATSTPLPPTHTPTPPAATATPTSPAATHTPTPLAATATPTSLPATTSTPTSLPIATNTTTSLPATASPTAALTATPTDCPNLFVDVSGNVFYNAIHYLACRGVVNGTDATHFAPAGTSTRGQFAKVVVLGFGLPFYTPTAPDFTDVPATYFAYLYIETGFHAAILSGFDTATCTANGLIPPCYQPNLAITRGQLTRLVVNAAGYPLYTPSAGPDFTDVPTTNVFYTSIETAYHQAIVGGYPDHTFRPNNLIRRDEMTQIVYQGVTHSAR